MFKRLAEDAKKRIPAENLFKRSWNIFVGLLAAGFQSRHIIPLTAPYPQGPGQAVEPAPSPFHHAVPGVANTILDFCPFTGSTTGFTPAHS